MLKETTLGLYELEGDLISLLVSSVLFCSPSNLRGFNMIYLDQLMPFRMQRGKAMVAFLAKGEGNGGFPRQGGRQWCPFKARGKAMVSFQGKGEGHGGLPRQVGRPWWARPTGPPRQRGRSIAVTNLC